MANLASRWGRFKSVVDQSRLILELSGHFARQRLARIRRVPLWCRSRFTAVREPIIIPAMRGPPVNRV